MKKIFCDRCGTEIKAAYSRIYTGVGASNMYELCEHCDEAFGRFMGINTPGGGYEKLDSEVAEQCK